MGRTTVTATLVATLAATTALTAQAGGDATTAGATACRPAVHTAVLPAWARAGFSDKRPRMPFAVSRRGMVGAIVFGNPLTAPPRRTVANKILWVAHHPRSATAAVDLKISARRMRGTEPRGRPVTWTVAGGPGPSYDDVPTAGCWRLTLTWGRQTDQIDFAYQPRAAGSR